MSTENEKENERVAKIKWWANKIKKLWTWVICSRARSLCWSIKTLFQSVLLTNSNNAESLCWMSMAKSYFSVNGVADCWICCFMLVFWSWSQNSFNKITIAPVLISRNKIVKKTALNIFFTISMNFRYCWFLVKYGPTHRSDPKQPISKSLFFSTIFSFNLLHLLQLPFSRFSEEIWITSVSLLRKKTLAIKFPDFLFIYCFRHGKPDNLYPIELTIIYTNCIAVSVLP